MNVDLNPFLLVDPPAGAVEQFQRAIASCSFSWTGLPQFLTGDPDQRVTVTWEIMSGVVGNFRSYDNKLVLSQYEYDPSLIYWDYVVLHELGHLVDYVYLNNIKRRDIMTLFRRHPDHESFVHICDWRVNSNTYWHAVHEAWADLFVQCYAPQVIDPVYPVGRYNHKVENWLRDTAKSIVERIDTMTVESWASDDRWKTAQLTSMNLNPNANPSILYIAAEGSADVPNAIVAAAKTPTGMYLPTQAGVDTVPQPILDEIKRLKPGTIRYCSGTNAIKPAARVLIEAAAKP